MSSTQSNIPKQPAKGSGDHDKPPESGTVSQVSLNLASTSHDDDHVGPKAESDSRSLPSHLSNHLNSQFSTFNKDNVLNEDILDDHPIPGSKTLLYKYERNFADAKGKLFGDPFCNTLLAGGIFLLGSIRLPRKRLISLETSLSRSSPFMVSPQVSPVRLGADSEFRHPSIPGEEGKTVVAKEEDPQDHIEDAIRRRPG
ncbi:uncharacterized protein LOC125383246 [Haliotis rufescens]|uniref:uncharacterized protein LOC125383246 n=1 Tax=Haliotis rufescens TaxID=6454 RepID=UPI00201F1295|nr:uncharacterized protein LOC125383246 [Haliotis rufescens]